MYYDSFLSVPCGIVFWPDELQLFNKFRNLLERNVTCPFQKLILLFVSVNNHTYAYYNDAIYIYQAKEAIHI